MKIQTLAYLVKLWHDFGNELSYELGVKCKKSPVENFCLCGADLLRSDEREREKRVLQIKLDANCATGWAGRRKKLPKSLRCR